MIAIVDTGGANHASIQNALARLDAPSEVTADRARLAAASHLILPGVGHAGHAMERLRAHALDSFLMTQTKPTLGICLGLQILFSESEEGNVECLGLLPGRVRRLEPSSEFRVPHMGWTPLMRRPRESRLLAGIDADAYFYFVHSFRAPASEWATALAQAPQEIPSVIEYKNFFATQFHPERSGEAGAKVLSNFLQLQEGEL